jgi:maltooligosyltrehalose trehalohydrolase
MKGPWKVPVFDELSVVGQDSWPGSNAPTEVLFPLRFDVEEPCSIWRVFWRNLRRRTMLFEHVAGTAPARWGATIVSPNRALFRLWAPDEQRISLEIDGKNTEMRRHEDGWYSLLCGAEPGQSYQFILSDGTAVADPASNAQSDALDGPSLLIDHDAYRWKNENWRGRPWEEAVIYELHIATFSEKGTFLGAIPYLPELANIGITAIELMPVAHFPGDRGWGYDGVLHYAPHNAYGTPDELKALVDAAHGLGMMVILDVVYNHFGPVGNMLTRYASAFFNEERHTPWGAGVDFDREEVRQFFSQNAHYWLSSFRMDGLRFDAVEHIVDRRKPSFLYELTSSLRAAFPDRHVHLIAEDAERRKHLVAYDHEDRPVLFSASWNDDFHHALHVLMTKERSGHYLRFADEPTAIVREVLATGFNHKTSPELVARVAPQSRVGFLQNHDQVGNRMLGERLVSMIGQDKMDALTAVLLSVPHIPMLFMGDDYGENNSFHFFADYDGEIGDAVRTGRPDEAKNFGDVPEDLNVNEIPDPLARRTFDCSKLDWKKAATESGLLTRQRIAGLIRMRREHIVPLLKVPEYVVLHSGPAGVISIDWVFRDGCLQVRANLSDKPTEVPTVDNNIVWKQGALTETGAIQPLSVYIAVAPPSFMKKQST